MLKISPQMLWNTVTWRGFILIRQKKPLQKNKNILYHKKSRHIKRLFLCNLLLQKIKIITM